MKKLLASLLACMLVVSAFSGCGKDKDKNTSSSEAEPGQSQVEDGKMKDGEYTAVYSDPAIDRTIDQLTVTVTDGVLKITEYVAKEDLSAAAADPTVPEASSSQAASSSAAASSTTSTDTEAGTNTDLAVREHLLEILDAYESVGSDIEQMRPVEKAEEHTYRFIRMMRELTAAAKKGDTAPLKLGKYADGTYKATMPEPNTAGWTDYVEVTVKDGAIASITFDATKDGKKITEDTEANAAAPKPSEYYPAIVEAFTAAAGDLTKTFPPSGGALAVTAFSKLMTPTLANMTSGGAQQVAVPKYIDGTYKAEFTDFDENGWKDFVVVEVHDDIVSLVQFDSVHKDDEKKKRSSDQALSDKMKESTGTYSYKEMGEELSLRLEKVNGDPMKVENIAGATVSTNSMKQLVAEILATTACDGATDEVLQVERIATVKK